MGYLVAIITVSPERNSNCQAILSQLITAVTASTRNTLISPVTSDLFDSIILGSLRRSHILNPKLRFPVIVFFWTDPHSAAVFLALLLLRMRQFDFLFF